MTRSRDRARKIMKDVMNEKKLLNLQKARKTLRKKNK